MLGGAPFTDETLDHGNDLIGTHGTVHVHGEGFSGVFVDDVLTTREAFDKGSEGQFIQRAQGLCWRLAVNVVLCGGVGGSSGLVCRPRVRPLCSRARKNGTGWGRSAGSCRAGCPVAS